jgi:DNA-binding GntR family transcriptional regulator
MENVFEGIQVSKKKPLWEEVYDSLRRSILHGKLKVGQHLIEEKLAHQIGISRTPIREAFYKLEKDDLVTRLPTRGFAVRRFTKEDVEEIFGIRIALESYAASLATSHMTSDKMAVLEKKLEETEKAIRSKDNTKVIQLHADFHDLLYKSSKSKKLVQMIQNFSDYFHRYRIGLIRTEDNVEYTVKDHRRMLEAMEKKKPRLVENLVREHLERTREIVLKAIDQGKMVP